MYSTIIISKDRLQKLKRAASSAAHIPQINKVVIIDNCSIKKISDELNGDKIVHIKNNMIKGVSENRNIGIKNTSTDLVIFLDDDAYIEKLDLSSIEDYFNQNKDVGIVAPRLVYPNGSYQESVRSFPTPLQLIWRGLKIYKIHKPVWYKKYTEPVEKSTVDPTPVDWAIGACLIIRKNLFEKIGLFDERFKIVYDDVDFCTRVIRAGYKVIYWPDSRVIHEYTRTSAKFFSKANLQHISSIIRFFRKHGFRND